MKWSYDLGTFQNFSKLKLEMLILRIEKDSNVEK